MENTGKGGRYIIDEDGNRICVEPPTAVREDNKKPVATQKIPRKSTAKKEK